MVLNTLRATLKPLGWESNFFNMSTARIFFYEFNDILSEDNLSVWQRLQAKVPTCRTDLLDLLQCNGFKLVEGEIVLSIKVSCIKEEIEFDIATNNDIPELQKLAKYFFSKSRFRSPWYTNDDNHRLYSYWIENAVKGNFDHVCLLYRTQDGNILGFVSIRYLNNVEASIGLLAGYGVGEKLMQMALNWIYLKKISILKIKTQISNIAAIKLYIKSGASIIKTSYWLYR